MASVFEEALQLQSGSTLLHGFKAVYFKFVLVSLTVITRFIHPYAVPVALLVNIALLIYVGAKRVLVFVFVVWCALASIICLIDLALFTFTLSVVLNLVYGFATFSSLALFYVTTPPRYVRKLLGLNAVSLTYLFLDYSVKLVGDLLDILKARGWAPSARPSMYTYPLRALVVLMVSRVVEVTEALRARGVEE